MRFRITLVVDAERTADDICGEMEHGRYCPWCDFDDDDDEIVALAVEDSPPVTGEKR